MCVIATELTHSSQAFSKRLCVCVWVRENEFTYASQFAGQKAADGSEFSNCML